MPHEPELRQVKDINYKIVECSRSGVAKFIANSLYNVFIYETYHEWLIIVYLNAWLCVYNWFQQYK